MKYTEDIFPRSTIQRNGMKTLSKSAINVILKGSSTVEELLRVTLLGD